MRELSQGAWIRGEDMTSFNRVASRIRGSVAIVAVIAVGGLATVACGGGDSGGTSLRYGYDLSAQFTNTFDVAESKGDCDGIPMSYIYSSVLGYDPKSGELLPELATEWVIEGEAKKSITLTLRDDVTFHDGTKLDAAAVKQGIDRNNKNDQLSGLDPIQTIEVVNPTTLKIQLKNNQAMPLLYAMADARDGMIMSPSSVDTAGEHPIGSGPFKFIEYKPGQGISLERYDGYWEKDAYDFDGIEFTQVGTGPPALTALKAGSVDMIRAEIESLEAIESDENLGSVLQPSGAYLQFQMREKYKDGRKSPFADERVRKAMRYAINTEEINRIVERGKGEVASQPLPKDSPGYDPSIANAYPFDPAKAKALLTEAGLPNGFEFTMAIPGPGIKNMADQGQLIQDQLKKIGVTAKIVPILGQDIATQYYIQGGADSFAAARLASTFYPTAIDSQWGRYEFVAIWNGAENAVITDLMNKALGSNDQAEIAGFVQQAAQYTSEHALEVPIAFMPQIIGFDKSRVGGTFTGQYDICKAPDLSGLKMK